jgi:iodotyrosine deiodinase
VKSVPAFAASAYAERMVGPAFVPFCDRYVPELKPELAARTFYDVMRRRRSVRMFSDEPVSREVVEWLVRTAGSAPSGANKQPWRFVCVQDTDVKRRIRVAAEIEEHELYSGRASPEWLADLAPLGTDEHKQFLEIAPWLIVVFKLSTGDDGTRVYYPSESVGIACGFLLAAAHHVGLSTLTHTPSPMGFLNEILERPANEKPFLLVPIGYPSEDCLVPAAAIERRPIDAIMKVV